MCRICGKYLSRHDSALKVLFCEMLSNVHHKLTNVHYYCSLSLNFVTIILLMYLNPSDATVYMEFN